MQVTQKFQKKLCSCLFPQTINQYPTYQGCHDQAYRLSVICHNRVHPPQSANCGGHFLLSRNNCYIQAALQSTVDPSAIL